MKRLLPPPFNFDEDVLVALRSVDTIDQDMETALAAITGDDLFADMKRFQIYDRACQGRHIPPLFPNSLMQAFDRVVALQQELPSSQVPSLPQSAKLGFAYRIISDSYDQGGYKAALSAVHVFKMTL